MTEPKLHDIILWISGCYDIMITCGVDYCPLHLPLPRPLPDHQDVVATPLPLLPGQPVPSLLVSYYLPTWSLLFSLSLITIIIDHYLSSIFTHKLPRSELHLCHHALALAGNVHNVEMRVGTILHHSIGTPACRQLVQFYADSILYIIWPQFTNGSYYETHWWVRVQLAAWNDSCYWVSAICDTL